MLFELGYSITQRGEIQWRYESFAHAITQKDQFVDVILQMLIERVGYVFQMITLAGDIGIFGNDSNLLIVFYVQIMPDDFVMQLHRF